MAIGNLIELPRGALFKEKSGSYDHEDKATQKLLSWRDAAQDQAMAELRDDPEYEEISNYIDLLQGRHYEGMNRAEYLSKFTDNRIARARIEALAYLTDIKPTIDIRTHVDAFHDQAEILKNILGREWTMRRIDEALEGVIDHALFGTGYWKLACSYPGEFAVIPCGMDTVLPIQQGRNLQDSTAILYRSFKPPHFYKQRWPDRAIDIEREAEPGGMIGVQSNQYSRPWNLSEYTWNSMSPALRYRKIRQSPRASAIDQWANFPLIQLQEYWIEDFHTNETGQEVIIKDPYRELDEHNYWYRVKPGERLYPRKRLLVFAGNRVMYDGPSPYWHGLFPFAKLRLNPIVWASGGLSLYRDLKPINKSLNHIGAGVENVVDKAIKPIVVSKEGAVPSTSWSQFFTDRPGAKLKLTPIANPTSDVRFIDPPVLPAYVQNFQAYLLQTFREIAGTLDITALGKKKQMPGGDTIEQFKDSLTGPRRREIRSIEMFLEDAGRIAVPCITQFFSRDQRLRLLGPMGITKQDFDAAPGSMWNWTGQPEEFYKNFTIEIVAGSLHSGSKDRERMIALQMYRMGALSLKELYRRLDIGNADQVLAEIKEERGQGLGMPVKGKQQTMTRGAKNGQPV